MGCMLNAKQCEMYYWILHHVNGNQFSSLISVVFCCRGKGEEVANTKIYSLTYITFSAFVHSTFRECIPIASYPGHVGGGKSGLVSTVCACANNSRNFSQTSPIMDKLHVVVMRRNNQTRYMACSVAAVFTRRWLPRDTSGYTTRTTLQLPSVPPSLCL